MRTLNSHTKSSVRVYATKEPEIYKFAVAGRKFAYDVNSMMLLTYDTNEEGDIVENAGASWQPNVPPVSRAKCRRLVFQTCYTCNLACKYCMVQKHFVENDGPVKMDMKMAQRAVHMLTPDGVGFFGGEPFMNWDFVQEFMTWFDQVQEPKIPTYSITTNGCLIVKEKVAELQRHNVNFVFSLDGPAMIHNELRVNHAGIGSYDAAMTGLTLLKEGGYGKKITLRATFSPETSHLLERTKFLNELVYRGYASHVSVEPAYLTESTCINREQLSYAVDDRTADLMRDEYMQVAVWMVAEVKAGRRPSLHHLTKTIERLLYKLPALSECGAGMGYLSVDPRGDVFACHRPMSTKIGNLMQGGIDERLRLPWCDNRSYASETCSTCPIRYACGGGCREESVSAYGVDNIHKPLTAACSFKNVFFETAAWIISELDHETLVKWIPMPGRK